MVVHEMYSQHACMEKAPDLRRRGLTSGQDARDCECDSVDDNSTKQRIQI